MDEYTDAEIPPGLPLSAADLALAHYAVPRKLGTLPFGSDGMITRSLWVVFLGEWGFWTHAVLPIDNRIDMGDSERIASECDLAANLIDPPGCHDDEEALVILPRPAPPDPGPADEHIFRLIHEAAVTRETAPWSFFITGPNGARELHACAGDCRARTHALS